MKGCYWVVGRDTPHPRVVVELDGEKDLDGGPFYRDFPTVGTAEVWAKAHKIDLVWDADSTEFFAND
jgi:hypothetical protein